MPYGVFRILRWKPCPCPNTSGPSIVSIVSECRFHFTEHQTLRVSERDLSSENLKNVVRYPHAAQFVRRGVHGGIIRKFRKTVEGRTLVVVAEIKG